MTHPQRPHLPAPRVLGLVICLVASLALSACAAGPAPDSGTLENGVYHNPYFGFDLPIPKTWTVLTGEAAAQAMNASRNEVLPDDAPDHKAVEQSIKRSSDLFVAVDSLTDTRVVIFAAAENVVNLRQVTSGEAYLKASISFMSTTLEAQETGPVHPILFGVKEASTVTLRMGQRLGGDYRSIFATVIRGHALTFVVTAVDLNGLAEGGHLVREIRFTSNPGPAPLSNGQIQGITGGVLFALGVLGRVIWSARKRRRERRQAAQWAAEAGPSNWPE